jgi:hypothetical protein
MFLSLCHAKSQTWINSDKTKLRISALSPTLFLGAPFY